MTNVRVRRGPLVSCRATARIDSRQEEADKKRAAEDGGSEARAAPGVGAEPDVAIGGLRRYLRGGHSGSSFKLLFGMHIDGKLRGFATRGELS